MPSDFVLPKVGGQRRCIRGALTSAGLGPDEIDILNTHATSTRSGDEVECEAVRAVFGGARGCYVNNTKSFIGHAMGAAGALELAGNLPAFEDGLVHPTLNIDDLDPACELENLVCHEPTRHPRAGNGGVRTILNTSFGMLGINSAVVVRERHRHMSNEDIVIAIKDIIATIAPDEDLSRLDMHERLREQIELDSMDFLDIVMELRKRYGVQIPEEEYRRARHAAGLRRLPARPSWLTRSWSPPASPGVRGLACATTRWSSAPA